MPEDDFLIAMGLDFELDEEILKKKPDEISMKDIYAIAMENERSGEKLYTLLSSSVKDPAIKNLFTQFAEEEDKHYKAFRKRLSEISGVLEKESVSESAGGIALYSAQKLFDRELLHGKLKNIRDIESTYEFLISMELDSVLFYQEIRKSVPAESQGFVDEVIEEERRHFLRLMQMRQAKGV